MKTPRKALDNRRRLKVANHVFFATAVLFVIHQNTLQPERPVVEAPLVAQALHYQPQVPPPAFDPDQLSSEEVEIATPPAE